MAGRYDPTPAKVVAPVGPGRCWGRRGGGGARGDRHRDARRPRPRRGDHGDGRDPRRTRPARCAGPGPRRGTGGDGGAERATDDRVGAGLGRGPRRRSTTATTPTATRWPAINATRETDVRVVASRSCRSGSATTPAGAWSPPSNSSTRSPRQATKAAIFERWLATPQRRFDGADTPVEALAASLAADRRASTWR